MTNNKYCFCGSALRFIDCCEPYIKHAQLPATAEQLMRSRYSAFNIGNVDYLIKTLSPEKRQIDDHQQIQDTIINTFWLGLKIIPLSTKRSATNQEFVEFVAFYQDKSNILAQLHEKSRFIRVDNRWFYVDGKQLPPIKLARNDICICGSGIKFKKCHGISN